MKTLIFIVLKIVEIVGGAWAVFYGLPWLGKIAYTLLGYTKAHTWVQNLCMGIVYIFVIAVVIFLGCVIIFYLIPEWWDKNRQWAESINNKLKSK